MNASEMTDQQLHEADAMVLLSGRVTLTDAQRAVKAELGRRAAEERTVARRSAAGRKGAASRARREAAGIPARRRGFSFDNAPAGGWTEADRV